MSDQRHFVVDDGSLTYDFTANGFYVEDGHLFVTMDNIAEPTVAAFAPGQWRSICDATSFREAAVAS